VELDLRVVQLGKAAFVTRLDRGERRYHGVGASGPAHVHQLLGLADQKSLLRPGQCGHVRVMAELRLSRQRDSSNRPATHA
jgi:hypothetical protein